MGWPVTLDDVKRAYRRRQRERLAKGDDERETLHPCPACNGGGQYRAEECPWCGGRGHTDAYMSGLWIQFARAEAASKSG